jgi:putative ABC transport system permease protein
MLAGVLATLALVLGLIGLYGVLSFGVAQRRREFGVRLSIGATPASVRALILREGAMLTLAGAALGAAAAAGVVSVIGAVLYDTSMADWPHYVVGIAFVLLCSLLAFWIPAHRASVTNPLVALRSE